MGVDSDDSARISRRRVLVGAAALTCQVAFSRKTRAEPTPPKAKPVGALRHDAERFVQDCIRASQESEPQAAVLEVLARSVRAPRAMLAAVGEPHEAGITVLHRSKTLTIFNATWTPQMNLMPHNHLMWANIGIYTGREDNILWRRAPKHVEAFGAKALFEGDVASLPPEVIHSVTNPLRRFTGGIHIYGGDFFAMTRSQWNPETLAEEPSDGAAIRKMFQQENQRFKRKT
jgi:predicted metal-dependent enzyme (double-stranded beta helix superfamily)